MNTHWQRIDATRATSQLPDLLNRVRDRGEHFLIVRDGETVAELGPTLRRSGTLEDWMLMLEDLPDLDPGFERDLKTIQTEQPPMSDGPWPS